jgi:hypothetical protein
MLKRQSLLTLKAGTVLAQAPAVDRLNVKAPVAPNFEGREPTRAKLTVNRRRMNFQVIRKFFDRENFATFTLHLAIALSLGVFRVPTQSIRLLSN